MIKQWIAVAVSIFKATGILTFLSMTIFFRWRPITNFSPFPTSESGAQTATCSLKQPGIALNPQNRNSLESAGSWNLESVAGGGKGSRGYSHLPR